MLKTITPACMMSDLTYGARMHFAPSYSLPPSSDSYARASMPSDVVPAQDMGSYGMHMSTYGSQMMPATVPSSQSSLRHRHFPSMGSNTFLDSRSAFASGPVRRRISRACDQCNQLRTKCDGKLPCAHCVDFSLKCAYNRERKKRGKASRKDIARQKAAAASADRSDDGSDTKKEQKPLPVIDTPTAPLAKAKTHVRRLSTILPSPAPPAPPMLQEMPRQRQSSLASIHSVHQQRLSVSPTYKVDDTHLMNSAYPAQLSARSFASEQQQLHAMTATPPYPQDTQHSHPHHLAFNSSAMDTPPLFQATQLQSPFSLPSQNELSFHNVDHSPQFTMAMPVSHSQAQTPCFVDQSPMSSFQPYQGSPDHSPTYMAPSRSLGSNNGQHQHHHHHPHAQQLPTPQPQHISVDESCSLTPVSDPLAQQPFSNSHTHSVQLSRQQLPNSHSHSHHHHSHSLPSSLPSGPYRRATMPHIQAPTYDAFALLSPASQHEMPSSAGLAVTSSMGNSGEDMHHSSSHGHGNSGGLLLSGFEDGITMGSSDGYGMSLGYGMGMGMAMNSGWLTLPSPPPTGYTEGFEWAN